MALDLAFSLRLDLCALPPVGAGSPFEVREVPRTEMGRVLGGTPALDRRPPEVDVAAPAGWRCFVAFDNGRPVHVSFVELRPGRPLLFGAITEPSARGRGAFRATVRHLAERLREADEVALYSSTAWTNRASLRAHRRAGFTTARRHVDLRLLGVSLRSLGRRLLRKTG